MRLRELSTDTAFRFPQSSAPYFYNGNGWYGFPYSGGPWHTADNPQVILIDDMGRDLPTQAEFDSAVAAQVVNY